jgi:hypothetical protein
VAVLAAHGFSHSEFFLIFVKASALFGKVFRFVRQYIFLPPLLEVKIYLISGSKQADTCLSFKIF